jgi:hypothetical protein
MPKGQKEHALQEHNGEIAKKNAPIWFNKIWEQTQ